MTDRLALSPTPEYPLIVAIDNAQMNDMRVTFAISMKTILPQYSVKEVSVTRTHEDFEWLHKMISEQPKYLGLVIPPIPPKPEIAIIRDAGFGNIEDDVSYAEEYKKIQTESISLPIEDLKRTCIMHEKFLQKVGNNSVMRVDANYMEFLTSPDQLNSKLSSGGYFLDFFRAVKKSVGDTISVTRSSVDEPDPYFQKESLYRKNYIASLAKVVSIADTMTSQYKSLDYDYIKLYLQMRNSANFESNKLYSTYENLNVYFSYIRNIEARIAADEHLQLADTFRMDLRNNEACRDLLGRRIQLLITSDNSHKLLVKAKQSNASVAILDDQYQSNLKSFEAISESAKAEFERESKERVIEFQNNLTRYCNNNITHIKSMLKETQRIIVKFEAE